MGQVHLDHVPHDGSTSDLDQRLWQWLAPSAQAGAHAATEDGDGRRPERLMGHCADIHMREQPLQPSNRRDLPSARTRLRTQETVHTCDAPEAWVTVLPHM